MTTDIVPTEETTEPGTDLEVIEPDDILDDHDDHGLFDPHAYSDPRLEIHTETGQTVDELVIRVAGAITLPRTSPEACDLYRALTQGHQVRLELTGHVIGDAHDVKAKGDDEITVGTRKIRASRIQTCHVAGETHVL